MSDLIVSRLNAHYTGSEALILREVSFSVSQGEVIYLVGPNGSGKSTVFRALGKSPSVVAEIDGRLCGRPLPTKPIQWRELRVRWIPQEYGSIGGWTVRENLEQAARAEGVGGISPTLELFPDLEGILAHQVRYLSGGQKRMVDLAPLTLAPQGGFFWLDEPLTSLSRANTARFLSFLKSRIDEGTGLLIATHEPAAFPFPGTTLEPC